MEKCKKFYLVEYTRPFDPVAHTRIICTDDMKGVVRRFTKSCGWCVNFWNLISVDRAQELQKQYQIVIM